MVVSTYSQYAAGQDFHRKPACHCTSIISLLKLYLRVVRQSSELVSPNREA